MIIPLVWSNWAEGPARACWDQDIIDAITNRPFPGVRYQVFDSFGEFMDSRSKGAVLVIPARYNVDHVPAMNADLARLDWCIVILTSDEESLFPWRSLEHPNMRIWVQTPRPDRHPIDEGLRFLPLGFPGHGWETIHALSPEHARDSTWYFHGQVNHRQREGALQAGEHVPKGIGMPSPGFTQGLPREEYLMGMASAQIALCPCGPAAADTFRTWEALEAGSLPIVDDGPLPDSLGRALTDYPHGFWDLMGTPFPVVSDWADSGRKAIMRTLAGWPAAVNRAQSWWCNKKREMSQRLADDALELSGEVASIGEVRDRLTILLPTSPTQIVPDTSHIEQTIASLRAYPELEAAELHVMIDGVRPEQEELRGAYEEYVRRVLWLANHRWQPCLPLVFGEHLHQAEMTRRALEHVRTPTILFCEHDTPVYEPVPWAGLCDVVESDKIRVLRLHSEASILPDHRSLMLTRKPRLVAGVPVLPTVQWSQRPHVAQTGFYRELLQKYFGTQARTMIEDVMHGVLYAYAHVSKRKGWDRFRVGIYAPQGDMKRSWHLDTRAGEAKYPMKIAYDSDEVPFGAPGPCDSW